MAQITLCLNSLNGSDDFAWVCVCVAFRFYLGHSYSGLRLCLHPALVKTRRKRTAYKATENKSQRIFFNTLNTLIALVICGARFCCVSTYLFFCFEDNRISDPC